MPDDNVIESEEELELPDGDDSDVATGPPAEADDETDDEE